MEIIFNKDILLTCENELVLQARKLFLAPYDGQARWESLTATKIPTKDILRFMATTGMMKVWNRIMNDDDVRNTGYQVGEDIWETDKT